MLAGRARSMTTALLRETRVGEFRIHGKDEPVILVGNNKMGVYEALEAIGFSGEVGLCPSEHQSQAAPSESSRRSRSRSCSRSRSRSRFPKRSFS